LKPGFRTPGAALVCAAVVSLLLAAPIAAENARKQVSPVTQAGVLFRDLFSSRRNTQPKPAGDAGVGGSIPGEAHSMMEPVEEAQALSVQEFWQRDDESSPEAMSDEPATAGTGVKAGGLETSSGGQLEEIQRARERMEVKIHWTNAVLPPQLEPLYVRELTGIEKGRNDSNPVWSPSGTLLAFERAVKDRKEIVIARPDGSTVNRIYLQQPKGKGDLDFFFPGVLEEVSYNSGISWSPGGDRFVFMSNGGTGNYDLFLGGVLEGSTTRLTRSPEKDGLAHWSPAADKIVFVSGRSGKANLYLLDLATLELKPLTRGEKTYLYPQWSPDGGKIVMIYGSNENHDIYLIKDVERPFETIRPLTAWDYDDLRPVWSPDGKHVAFYSNYNSENDPKSWCLMVVAADGSDPVEGEELALRVVARNVNPDIERGPAWMPDSRRILYVENNRLEFFPIHIADIRTGTVTPLRTGTKINHDVVCSTDGTIAFRAQVEQWDHIFTTRLEEP
jgi:Tol biopolymer transport system component